jgi:hypothetical protein
LQLTTERRKPVDRRVVTLSLVFVLLAAVAATAAAAPPQPEEVPIYLNTENAKYKIRPGQVGVIQWTWYACTAGLVNGFMEASNFDLRLLQEDGSPYLVLTPEDVDELWGPIELFEDAEGYCRGRPDYAGAAWRYRLTSLPVGRYELHADIWIDHPLTDGTDWDGDGTPDVLTPEFFSGQTVNFIRVMER